MDDMTPPGEQDAELSFGPGKLRYYVMRIPRRPLQVTAMTRHVNATQCLSSAEGRPFWLLLAPPDTEGPVLDASKAWLLRIEAGEKGSSCIWAPGMQVRCLMPTPPPFSTWS